VRQLLQWVVFSGRPITAVELSICLSAINTENICIDEDCVVTDPKSLSALASGLLTLDFSSKDSMDSLIVSHRSVQEFLISYHAGDFRLEDQSAHSHIALACVTYLRLPSFATTCNSWEELNSRFIEFQFLDYAARCWPSHVTKLTRVAPALLDAMVDLFTGPNFLPWLQIYKSHKDIPTHQTFHDNSKPLHWAARLGLRDLVGRILSTGVDINQTGGFFGTALNMSAYNADAEMVEFLIEEGADVNCTAGYYHSALQAGAVSGNKKVIERLLRAGADIHAKGGLLSTPLLAAEKAGHRSIVEQLLEEGLRHPDKYEGDDPVEALGTAILRKDLSTVRHILQTGIDINERLPGFSDWKKEDERSHYPLILAIGSSSLEVVKCIIDAGADLEVNDGYHGSALAWAAYWGRLEVVEALLEAGANPLRGHYSGGSLPRFIRTLDDAKRKAVRVYTFLYLRI
jgi:ankyrin repeat protein